LFCTIYLNFLAFKTYKGEYKIFAVAYHNFKGSIGFGYSAFIETFDPYRNPGKRGLIIGRGNHTSNRSFLREYVLPIGKAKNYQQEYNFLHFTIILDKAVAIVGAFSGPHAQSVFVIN
jgi:hypothetical protein